MAKIAYDGEHIVKVAGSTVAVNTDAYADNDLVGTKLTITDFCPRGKGALLQAITLHDLDAQNAGLEVYIWDTNPSNTTFTNNSALDIADADLPNIIATFDVASGDWNELASNSVVTTKDLAIPVKPADGQNIYVALRSDGSTPTYTANGLSINFLFLSDA